MIDAGEGIISWMKPSSLHTDLATAGDKVIPLAAAILKMNIREKRDNRWQGPNDSENVGLEADAAYYIGINAEGFPRPSLDGGLLPFRTGRHSSLDINSACLAMVCSNSTQTSLNYCN